MKAEQAVLGESRDRLVAVVVEAGEEVVHQELSRHHHEYDPMERLGYESVSRRRIPHRHGLRGPLA
jgi:hypothetical protein